jgi:hypothetical protein
MSVWLRVQLGRIVGLVVGAAFLIREFFRRSK